MSHSQLYAFFYFTKLKSALAVSTFSSSSFKATYQVIFNSSFQQSFSLVLSISFSLHILHFSSMFLQIRTSAALKNLLVSTKLYTDIKYDFTTPIFRAISGHCNSLFDTASDKNLTVSYPFHLHILF